MKTNFLFLAPLCLLFSSCYWNSINDDVPHSLANYYEQNRADVQVFTIDAAAGETITGSEGTEITFPPNAFCDAKGNTVTGAVEIHLKEFYDLKEMFKCNVHTMTHNGDMLVSGGSLFLEATQNGKQLKVCNGTDVYGSMPVKTKAAGFETAMRGFAGINNNDDGATPLQWLGSSTSSISGVEGGTSIEFVTDSSGSQVVKYSMNWLRTGWTNCDAFYNVAGARTQFKVKIKGAAAGEVFLFAKGLTSMVKIYNRNGDYYETYESSIPVGTTGTLFVVNEWNDKLKFGSKEITVTGNDHYEVAIVPGSEAEMETALKAIPE